MANEEFVSIPISEFLSGMKAPASLYIQLPSGRHLLLFKEGSVFDHERLKTYQEKRVEHLWVLKKDYSKISMSSINFAIKAVDQPFDPGKKAFFIGNAAQAVYRNFSVLGINLTSYRQAEKVVEANLRLVTKNLDLNSLMDSLNELDDHMVAHSVAVSILAPVIGLHLGWVKEANLKTLSLGGLLHNIGKKHLPPELLAKPSHEFTHEELKTYQTHPQLGAEMLKGLELNNEVLMAIVFQHHERNNGTGYPQNLKSMKIHPMAKVVGLTAEFLDMTMPNPKTRSKFYSPSDALVYIQDHMGQPFDKEAFNALTAIVQDNDYGEETLKGAA